MWDHDDKNSFVLIGMKIKKTKIPVTTQRKPNIILRSSSYTEDQRWNNA